MNLRGAKFFIKLLGFLIFFAYMSAGIFGLLQFSHTSEMPMANCPYAQGAFSLCSNNFKHIDNWQEFSNVVSSSVFAFLILTLGIIFYFLEKINFSNLARNFYKRISYLRNNNLHKYLSEIIKWLSLFENSPSPLHRT